MLAHFSYSSSMGLGISGGGAGGLKEIKAGSLEIESAGSFVYLRADNARAVCASQGWLIETDGALGVWLQAGNPARFRSGGAAVRRPRISAMENRRSGQS